MRQTTKEKVGALIRTDIPASHPTFQQRPRAPRRHCLLRFLGKQTSVFGDPEKGSYRKWNFLFSILSLLVFPAHGPTTTVLLKQDLRPSVCVASTSRVNLEGADMGT